MTTADADKIVLEQLLAQAAGIRMRAKDATVGTRAGLLEQELTARLAVLVRAEQREVASAASEEQEEPLPLAASRKPGKGDR